MPTQFEDLGGEPALRAIIDDFVDRVFDDVMIGFIFRRANKARIKRFEYELAAELLGAGTPYTGRPLTEAHRPHKIMGGQFLRRRELFRQTLEAHHTPTPIIQTLLAHTDRLRPQITGDRDGECVG